MEGAAPPIVSQSSKVWTRVWTWWHWPQMTLRFLTHRAAIWVILKPLSLWQFVLAARENECNYYDKLFCSLPFNSVKYWEQTVPCPLRSKPLLTCPDFAPLPHPGFLNKGQDFIWPRFWEQPEGYTLSFRTKSFACDCQNPTWLFHPKCVEIWVYCPLPQNVSSLKLLGTS